MNHDSIIKPDDDYIKLFLRIYLLAGKIKSLVKVHNTNRFNDLVVLAILLHQTASVSELAQALSIKPSAMSEKVRRLQTAGLIEQAQSDDAREKKLTISKQGKEYWQQIMQEIIQHCDQQPNLTLDKTEIQTALEILNKIHL